MGSSVKKVNKVAKSPLGQLALSVAIGNSPFMAGIGGAGFGGSALRAGLTSGLVGIASGRGIDPKRMLTAGATAGVISLDDVAKLNNSNVVGTDLITKDDGSGIRDIFSTKDGLSLGDRFTNVQDSLSAGNYMDVLNK